MKVITYIHFENECNDAIHFYKEVLGGEILMFSRMGESPQPMPEHLKDRIMHSRLQIGETTIYMSDGFDENNKINKGNNISLSIDVDDITKIDELFAKLSAGGNVVMALQDTFWGARFGMLTDKFGIKWMLNCELKK